MNALKNFRLEHNLKQVDIPALLGYNVHSWRDYESGRRKVPQHVLKAIEIYDELQRIKKDSETA